MIDTRVRPRTATTAPDGMIPADDPQPVRVDAGCGLNIAGVYQDSATLDWAMQTCRRATRLDGESRVKNNLYDIKSFNDQEILLEAVKAALEADVIVVAIHAADVLPLELYIWLTAWLPRRASKMGVLTALIGNADRDNHTTSTTAYLQAVARKAELDFILHEYKPAASFPGNSTSKPTHATQLQFKLDGMH